MTDFPELDLRAALARIDRERAETEKFVAETRKLLIEAAPERYRLENARLDAETRKLNMEAKRARWLSLATALGAATIAAIALRLPEILHAFGIGP